MRKFNLLLICSIIASSLLAQSVSINTDGSTADPSSILDIKSTAAGVLFPRMTKVQRDAISTPAVGLMIYQTDNTPGLRVFNGTDWDLMIQKFAIFRDRKPDGDLNDPSAASDVQDRIFTEVEGEMSFLTIPGGSFTSFTINKPGTYLIEGSVPAFNVRIHQARIIQNGTEILGTTEFNDSGAAQTRSFYSGLIIVTTTSTIRIEHYTEAIQTPNGLGTAGSPPTYAEIYTILKITKIAD